MSRYKMLVTGRNHTIIDDCFHKTDDNFLILSTSLRFQDIDNHLAVFEPDVFAICLSSETRTEINRLMELKRKLTRMNISVVVIGDREDVEEFQRAAVYMADLVLEKPITIDIIRSKVREFLDDKKKQEEEERRMQEELLKIKEQARRKHVLVIDDDPTMLKIIKEHLHEKYDVATAISGKIAYKFLDSRKTDMILLDYEMPVEKGPEVLVKIRENEQLANIPVVFLTGITDREKIKEALSLKPQGYLLKPIDKEKLVGMIEKFIG